MIRYGTGFDVTAICFTHFHADHYIGAIGFVRTLSMLGRGRALDVYGPAPARPFLEDLLLGGTDPLAFEIRIHEVNPGDAVRRDGADAAPLGHEPPHHLGGLGAAGGRAPGALPPGAGPRGRRARGGAVGRAAARAAGDARRTAASFTPGRSWIRPRRGRRVAVTGDTRPCPETVAAARGADLLVHECTFGDAEADRAVETTHSTAREAGRMAREAGVARLVLTHLSTRYDTEPGAAARAGRRGVRRSRSRWPATGWSSRCLSRSERGNARRRPAALDPGPARHLARPAPRGARGGPRPPPDGLLPDELREVAAAVQRLSLGLTRDRKLVGARYLDDDRLLGAYLLFYWPVSYLQARGVLSELPRRPRSALDLGSGPGPVAFAALDAGAAEVMAADRSAPAPWRRRAGWPPRPGEPLATREWDPQRRGGLAGLAGGRKFDLITLGHVVNELFQGEGAATRRAGAARGGARPARARRLAGGDRAGAARHLAGAARGARPAGGPAAWRCGRPACSAAPARRSSAPPTGATPSGRSSRRRWWTRSAGGRAAQGGGEDELPRAGAEGGGVARAAAGARLPHRLRAAAVKGRLRYMGCGPEGRKGLALQEKDVTPRNRAFERLLRGRRRRDHGGRAARGRAPAVAGVGRPGDRGGREAGGAAIPGRGVSRWASDAWW